MLLSLLNVRVLSFERAGHRFLRFHEHRQGNETGPLAVLHPKNYVLCKWRLSPVLTVVYMLPVRS